MSPEPAALDLDLYDFELPPDRIAQEPAAEREAARLLCLDRADGSRSHHRVLELPALLEPGDLVVANASRVLPARLRGRRASGGAVEALILGPGEGPDRYRALLRSSGRLRPDLELCFKGEGREAWAQVVSLGPKGEVELAFEAGASPYALGETPLPPYIRRAAPRPEDALRYQTLFARVPGSVAAPTAGLHWSEAMLEALRERGIDWAELVLHVGPGTFRPLDEEALATRQLHAERYELPESTVRAVEAARTRGGRVVAVGTTSVRVLESCAGADGSLRAGAGETRLFLSPGDRFRVVDALLTNFHLPRSSLLLLVAAFAGREPLLDAYAEAISLGYRFYSYGDAMLIR